MAMDGEASPRRRGPFVSPAVALIGGSLLAVLLFGWLSLATRPTAHLQSAWWPAAGIALGLGIRFPRHYLWALAPAVSAVTLPVQLGADRPWPLAIALSVAVGVEMVIGTLLLRRRADTSPPRLIRLEDFGRLLAAAFSAAVAFDLMATLAELAVSGSAEAWTRLVTAAPKHAAGMLLVTPLFMVLQKHRPMAGRAEAVLQMGVTVAVTVYVFLINDDLPVSFLPFVPLVWAATRLTTLQLILQILVVAAIGSYGSARGTGIFAFDRLGAETGSVILQVFELTLVTVLVSLSLMVGQERDTAHRLNVSEELFRTNFDSSVAGQLMVLHNGSAWEIEKYNESAAAILPGLRDGSTTLESLLGGSATDALAATMNSLDGDNARLVVTTAGDRNLDVSVAAVADRAGETVYALHFQDVTEALRARRLEQADLERAGEVQRALLPGRLPTTPGWSIGAVSAPAKQVGGDFYDIRLHLPHAVISLGDVMGKGMGAGMLAAATRAALRSNAPATSPSTAIAHAAEVIDSDLHRSSAFVTLTYVLVDLVYGEFRFADAGHGLHFILRGSTGNVERFASEDLPMGLDSEWHERRGTLHPGDGILLLSDGLMDLWGGSVDDLERAVTECVRRFGTASTQTLVEALCAGADTSLDRDDVTAVALRRDPDGQA